MTGEDIRAGRPLSAAIGVRAVAARDSADRAARGLGTAVLAAGALVLLLATGLLCLVGIGLFLVPAGLRTVRSVATERRRLSRWGPEIPNPHVNPL
jgi:hypothetical protein